MKKLKEIKLNTFQLNVLLNEEEKAGFELLLNEGVYCNKCKGVCAKGVVNYSCRLNSMNNIVTDGECAICGNPVCRIMEFGENPAFFKKAVKFRKSIKN